MSLSKQVLDRKFVLSILVGAVLLGAATTVVTGTVSLVDAWASGPIVPAGQLGVGDRVTPAVDALDFASKIPAASTQAAGKALLFDASPLKKAPVPVVYRAPRATTAASSSRSSTGGWSSAKCSWYGPGFYGNTMAGGGVLTADSMVVAHKTLSFGTRVEFEYNGRTVIAVVQDRGPFIAGRTFDLGPGTARALGFNGVHTLRYRILGK